MIESPANLGTPKKRRHRHLLAMIKPNPYSLHGPPPMNWPASHRFWSSFIAVELAIEPGPRSGLIRKKRMAVLDSARPGRGQASQRGWLSCLLCCLRRAPRQGSPSVSHVSHVSNHIKNLKLQHHRHRRFPPIAPRTREIEQTSNQIAIMVKPTEKRVYFTCHAQSEHEYVLVFILHLYVFSHPDQLRLDL